jgi:hypothetical protein
MNILLFFLLLKLLHDHITNPFTLALSSIDDTSCKLTIFKGPYIYLETTLQNISCSSLTMFGFNMTMYISDSIDNMEYNHHSLSFIHDSLSIHIPLNSSEIQQFGQAFISFGEEICTHSTTFDENEYTSYMSHID